MRVGPDMWELLLARSVTVESRFSHAIVAAISVSIPKKVQLPENVRVEASFIVDAQAAERNSAKRSGWRGHTNTLRLTPTTSVALQANLSLERTREG